MKTALTRLAVSVFILTVNTLRAAVPQLINYQGRVTADGVNFEGTGQFRFALVDGTGTATYWSNDGTSTASSQPAAAVSLTVTKGLYSVLLGDTTLANMTAIPNAVFNNSDVRLRVWFNDGTHGTQLLTPDQRLAAVGYALVAGSVPDGAITGEKLAAGAAAANLNAGNQSAVPRGGLVLSPTENADFVNAGYVRIGSTLVGDDWQLRFVQGFPSARYLHSTVWTGSEMIIWGGYNNGNAMGDGRRYNVAANSWTQIEATGAPVKRWNHSAVWTGTEMIIWGGRDAVPYQDGARYNPATDSWAPVASPPAAVPARSQHTAVWTDSEMVVFGGFLAANLNSGARYNPAENTWHTVSTSGAPSGRWDHTAIWTGSEMIVWGGFNGGVNLLSDGGRYRPGTDEWLPLAAPGAALSARSKHSAVWTGASRREMIIWGGGFRDGARYNTSNGQWIHMDNAPLNPTTLHSAVWTGNEMIVWGGSYFGGGGMAVYDTQGARYAPADNLWTLINNSSAPPGRELHSAVWTGTQLLIWGGFSGATRTDMHTYTPPRRMILYQRP